MVVVVVTAPEVKDSVDVVTVIGMLVFDGNGTPGCYVRSNKIGMPSEADH